MVMTLKAARVNKGLTQLKAASLLGISPYSLSHYERGISSPPLNVVQKMETVYEVPFEEMYFFEPKVRKGVKP